MSYSVQNIRNVCLLGHSGSGKTALAESLLYITGAIDRMGKNIRSLHFAWGQFVVCAVLGLISMFLFEQPTWTGILNAKWAILYCGILSVGVAYTLQVVAQKNADPAFAVIILSTESVCSAVGGVLFGLDQI